MSQKGSYWNDLPDGRAESQVGTGKHLYTKDEAIAEANRCLFCEDAPCIKKCPTSINIPKFIKKISSGDIRGAAKTIFEQNMLGSSCASACPVEVLCAGDCVLQDLTQNPIEIGRLQHYATHYGLKDEEVTGRGLFTPKTKIGKKVALIGAGPASLSCAAHLALNGVEATIFEKRKLPGGLNTTGIAPYKLETEASLTEVDWILSHGIDLKTNTEIGKDVSAESLISDYDAVFLGMGLGADNSLNLPGEGSKGYWPATELIEEIKNSSEFKIPENVKTALIVGGGNTAIDAARALAKLNLDSVSMVYRGSEERASGYVHELKAAYQDNVQFIANRQPKSVKLNSDGHVCGLEVVAADGDKAISVIDADWIVFAIGQSKLTGLIEQFKGVDMDSKGCVKVDEKTYLTTNPKVYAGGDCINGGKEVVNAAADGRDAAIDMLKKWL
jgi:dihydropyrimidine dehydrogenase (NAD+) subunit PreT